MQGDFPKTFTGYLFAASTRGGEANRVSAFVGVDEQGGADGEVCVLVPMDGSGDEVTVLDEELWGYFRLDENDERLGCGTMMGADLL